MPKGSLVDYYVLACSSAKYGPILDFSVSVDSSDPKDFKFAIKSIWFHAQMGRN